MELKKISLRVLLSLVILSYFSLTAYSCSNNAETPKQHAVLNRACSSVCSSTTLTSSLLSPMPIGTSDCRILQCSGFSVAGYHP